MLRRLLTVVVVCTSIAASAVSAGRTPVLTPAKMLVGTSWLAAHLSDKNLVILHVGTDRTAYDAGHIPGARFLALSEIAVTRKGIPNELPSAVELKTAFERLGIGDHSRIVLYGDMFGLFAARAYFTLDYLGHGSNASLLDGGLEKWIKEYSATRSTTTSPGTAMFTVHLHPELIIELPAVSAIVSNRSVAIIDARQPADYFGTTADPSIRRPGHLPGAKHVFWAGTLVDQQNPVFKTAMQLRALYTATGVKPGARVIVYCKTGVQAAHDYFTLKLAGFRPVLYDGSFIEWSNAFGTPIESGAGGQL